MLRSAPSQNNLSEEDSSASDAGSEVSFGPAAAETDRFGFILTNGSTAGSEGPPPELVRQREAKWINIITQWDCVVQKKTSKVKEQCQKGIPASLRARCWPLLCGATNKMKHNNIYKSLDSQPALQSWVDVIERDLDRQFPFHEMFLSRDGHGQRGLFRVLKAYTQFQPDDGYCQAQGPVAAVLLMNMPTEEAFWCLVQISEEYLPGYYSPLLEGVHFDAAMLPWILKRMCPAAHEHLQRHGVEPLMFATDWLMCLFIRHLPFNTLLRVWDLFFCHGVRVLFQVVVVLVRRVLGRARQRQECQGQMETLERLRGVREQVQLEDDTFIAEMCSVPLSGKELEKQTEKELVKWRKDRPTSTFDPRGRCHGYRVAWKRVREMEAERDRREREQGNLSVPLVRSASTLSLSPSLMRTKLRKSGKTNAGDEWEGGGRVGRQISMGPWEGGWRDRWMEHSPKRVQCLEEEEDKVSEKQKEERKELNLTGPVEPFEEPRERTENQGAPTKHLGERKILKEPRVKTQPTEQQKPEEEDNQPQDSPTVLPQQAKHCEEEEGTGEEEERMGETDQTRDPTKVQSIENVVQHIAHRTPHQELPTQDQREEQDHQPNSQSQSLDEQSHNRLQQEQDMENKDRVETREGEEKQVTESENVSVKEKKQTEIEKDTHTITVEDIQAVTDTSKEPVIQMGMKAVEKREAENPQIIKEVQADIQVENENRTPIDTDKEVEVETAKESDPAKETESQQEPDAITDTDQESQVKTVEIRGMDDKGLTETKTEAESHTETDENKDIREDSSGTQKELETQTTTETNIDDLQRKILSLKETHEEAEIELLDECTEEETDLTVDTATCTETNLRPVDSKTESDEALPEYSESMSEIELSKPTEASEETVIHTKKEVDEDTSARRQTKGEETAVEETQTETEMYQETTDSITPQENSQTSIEPATSASEPDEKTSSLPTASPGKPAAEQPRGLVTISPVEDQYMEKMIETVAGAEGVFVSSPKQTVLSNVPQPTHKNESCTIESQHNATDPHHQNKEDSQLPADQAELEASGPIHSAGPRVRKSSSSRGFRLSRRLSEDLFTAPQQTTQSQSISSQPDQSKHTLSQSDPAPTHSLDQTHLNSAHSGGTIHRPIQEGTESELCKRGTSGTEEGTAAQREQRPPDTPKHFGLFRRLRGEQPKNTQEKPKKIQVPKIMIQDFSDRVGRRHTLEEMEEEKLSSRERRKRGREQKRREKEEEKLTKKREKELEKERERERRKPKSRGGSFQVQRGSNAAPPGNIGSQKLSSRSNSVSYSESYF